MNTKSKTKNIVRYIMAILLLCVVTMGVVGCSKEPDEKVFTDPAGISITLNESFHEKEIVSQTLYLESLTSIFTALKEDFSLFQRMGRNPQAMSLMDYAGMVITNNSLSVTATEADGLVSFTYEKEVSGNEFYYYAVVFKGTDAFWLCQFACLKNAKETYASEFVKWAKTIAIS